MTEKYFSEQQLKDAVFTIIRSMKVARHMDMDSDMDMDMSSHSGHMDHSGHMGHMEHMEHMDHSGHGSSHSMNMFFTSKYIGTPVLFENLSAANGGQAFGIFLLFFALAILTKGLEFAKNYLEQKVWNNPNYIVSQNKTIIEQCECDGEAPKVYSSTEDTIPASQKPPRLVNVLTRDILRISLCFIIELFGYSLMLVAMSFSLVYFFAVVTGMALGRFFFERVGDKIMLRPGQNNYQTRE